MGLLNCKKRKKEIKNSSPSNNESDTNINNRTISGMISPEETSSTNNKSDIAHLKNSIKLETQKSNKKEKNLSKNEKKLETLNQRKEELDRREQNIRVKENLLKNKEDQNNIDLKNLKDFINQMNKEMSEKEKALEEKEAELNLKNQELIEEKKNFEEIKKKFELSKIPNEVGLQNIGATCYMNATLQALSNTDKFTTYFLTKYKFDPNDNNKKMSNEMYKVLINLWDQNKKKGDYPPNDFKNSLSEENPLFAGIQANDSKDLINFLLERFHQEMNNPSANQKNDNNIVNQMNESETLNIFVQDYFSSNQSIITDCFYGIIETKSTCSGCKLTKYNFQIYSFLEFPLKEVNAFMFQNGKREVLVNQDGTNPDIDIYECFDYNQKLDLMTGQNQMYCNICNGNTDTYYGTSVYSLPNYLIINLNRGKGATYKCKVNFPEVLNLLNYVTAKEGNTAMKLYAVICHYGPSSMSGHFIAYCRHRINQKWYKYNDSQVTECTQSNEYKNGMPYILFYQAV